MALCPKCKKGTLKSMRDKKGIQCSNYLPKKNESGSWSNAGSCNFKIYYENKLFGDFTDEDFKNLIAGKEIKKGDKIAKLDVKNPYFIVDSNSELEDWEG